MCGTDEHRRGDGRRGRDGPPVVGDRADDIADDIVVTVVDATDDTKSGDARAACGRPRRIGTNGIAVAVEPRHDPEHACGVQVSWPDEPTPLPAHRPALPRTRVNGPDAPVTPHVTTTIAVCRDRPWMAFAAERARADNRVRELGEAGA